MPIVRRSDGPGVRPTLTDVPAHLIDRFLGPRSLLNVAASSTLLRAQVLEGQMCLPAPRHAAAMAQAIGGEEWHELAADALAMLLESEPLSVAQYRHVSGIGRAAARRGPPQVVTKARDTLLAWLRTATRLDSLAGARSAGVGQALRGARYMGMRRSIIRVTDRAARAGMFASAPPPPAPAAPAAFNIWLANLPSSCVPTGELRTQLFELGGQLRQSAAKLDFCREICSCTDCPLDRLDDDQIHTFLRMLHALVCAGEALPLALHSSLGDLLRHSARLIPSRPALQRLYDALIEHPHAYCVQTQGDPVPEAQQGEILIARLIWDFLSPGPAALADDLRRVETIWCRLGELDYPQRGSICAELLGYYARRACADDPAAARRLASMFETAAEHGETSSRRIDGFAAMVGFEAARGAATAVNSLPHEATARTHLQRQLQARLAMTSVPQAVYPLLWLLASGAMLGDVRFAGLLGEACHAQEVSLRQGAREKRLGAAAQLAMLRAVLGEPHPAESTLTSLVQSIDAAFLALPAPEYTDLMHGLLYRACCDANLAFAIAMLAADRRLQPSGRQLLYEARKTAPAAAMRAAATLVLRDDFQPDMAYRELTCGPMVVLWRGSPQAVSGDSGQAGKSFGQPCPVLPRKKID